MKFGFQFTSIASRSQLSSWHQHACQTGGLLVTCVRLRRSASSPDLLMTPALRITRFMTDAARREQETMKKKATPKLSLSITGGVSRNSTATPPRHTSGNLTPPVTPPITPSSSFRSSTPTGTTGVCVEMYVWDEERQIAHTCRVNGGVETD